MLPQMKLDNDSFENLSEEFRNRIAGIYPEWTDYNYHDPGITLLELFAWLRENQQYFLEQLGPEHYRQFFRLAGIRPEGRRPALVLAESENMHLSRELKIPAGTRFLAGGLPFESVTEECIPAARISRAEYRDKDDKIKYFVETGQLMSREDMAFSPFGRTPQIGDSVVLTISGALRAGQVYRLSAVLKGTGRNSRGEGEISRLSALRWEYRIGSSWVPLTILEDGTLDFLYSGRIAFRADYGDPAANGEALIRAVFSSGEYDEAPVITSLSLRQAALLQRQSFSWPEGRELGEGTGFPDQELSLPSELFLADSVEISAEDLENPRRMLPWSRSENLYSLTPESRAFIADEKKGTVRFGNGFYGLPPEGRIVLTALKETAGAAGNIKAGSRFFAADPKEKALDQAEFVMARTLVPGRDPESTEETLLRLMKEQRRIRRAVTLKDYETLVKETPGVCVHSCHAYTKEDEPKTIHLVVRPGTGSRIAPASSTFRKNILSWLEDKKIIGTRIRIHSPEYIRVSLTAELVPAPQYREVEAMVEQEIRRWFEERDALYGKPLDYNALFGRLDRLPCVRRITLLSLDAEKAGILRNRNKDLIPPVNGVFLPGNIDIIMDLYGTGED